jgi:hypothetical protein
MPQEQMKVKFWLIAGKTAFPPTLLMFLFWGRFWFGFLPPPSFSSWLFLFCY